jgi:hypothetical protein
MLVSHSGPTAFLDPAAFFNTYLLFATEHPSNAGFIVVSFHAAQMDARTSGMPVFTPPCSGSR